MSVTEVRGTSGFQIPAKIIFAQEPKKRKYKTAEIALDYLLKTYENFLKYPMNTISICF